jgi:hypothetical protein
MNDELKMYLYRERKKCEYDMYRDKRKKNILYPISYLHTINLIEHQHTNTPTAPTAPTAQHAANTESTDSTDNNESESTK